MDLDSRYDALQEQAEPLERLIGYSPQRWKNQP